jgi:hypothetical protein
MTTAAERARRAPPSREIPRGFLEHFVRIASALLVIAVALALISAPGLPADESEGLRSTRLGGGIALLVLVLALQVISPRRK